MPLYSRVFPLWSFVSPKFRKTAESDLLGTSYPTEELRYNPPVMQWSPDRSGHAEGHWRVTPDKAPG